MAVNTPQSASILIEETISETLDQMGIMFRIFSRLKAQSSLDKKISSNPKYGVSDKIQDLIGIRIVLYFADDITAVHDILKTKFNERVKDNSIDEINTSTFEPVRYNLVYDIPPIHNMRLDTMYQETVDSTFELQIRTVLSEGWHEVEHDLRYKCKDDWESYPGESRKLNGVYATLETSEWTMIRIFEEISYGHYKSNNWNAMLRQKFRLRIQGTGLKESITNLFDQDIELAKKFFRIDRVKLVKLLSEKNFGYEISLSNLVFFANIFFIQAEEITQITPEPLLDDYDCETQ